MQVADDQAHTLISVASDRLDKWIEAQGFKGWDPFDALNSFLIRSLTFGNRRLGQAWLQLFKRNPINFRSFLGVPKGYNPKGLGLFLATYWRKYLVSKSQKNLDYARFFANWLMDNISPGYKGACWGYNFDWPNRASFTTKGTPTIVNTAFIGMAFLDLYQLGNELYDWHSMQAFSREKSPFLTPLDVACSACNFIRTDLLISHSRSDEICFGYTPSEQSRIHNANVLGASLLSAVAKETGKSDLADLSLAAARFTARRQLSNGAWEYGEGSSSKWIDNFHTGYVLLGLKRIGRSLGTAEFDEVIRQGYGYWKVTMFLDDGTPKYYAENTYPIDAHCIAQGILTFLEFSDLDPEAFIWAKKLAIWGIRNMQDSSGFFHYQKHRYYSIRIPYMRWTQAWMQRALSEFLIVSSHADFSLGRAVS